MADPIIQIASVLYTPTDWSLRWLPESPFSWVLRGQSVLGWVNGQEGADAKTGSLHFLELEEQHTYSFPLPERPGFAAATDHEDTLVLGLGKALALYNVVEDTLETLTLVETDRPDTIINDGAVLPDGSGVIFGTKHLAAKEPVAGLYLYRHGHTQMIRAHQRCSNGKGFWHHDGQLTLLDIDSPERTVARYTFDSTPFGDPAVALDLRELDGVPDGMAGPSGERIVVAFYNPSPVPSGRAVQFNLNTRAKEVIFELPGSPRVTCPHLMTIAGVNHIVFTTAAEGLSDSERDQSPNAGALFAVPTDLEIPLQPQLQIRKATSRGA